MDHDSHPAGGLLTEFAAARRRFLCALAAGGAFAACGRGAAPHPRPAVPLASIPDGGRLEVVVGDLPIEIRRAGATVRARSLRCTHMGCRVQWNPATQRYRCPCHEGIFDADGRVFSGPPPAPLRTIAAVIVADEVLLELPA